QLDLIRHVAYGRLSELFGERVLPLDRKYRLLSYKIDEQMKGLSKKENDILFSYAAGVNAGAKRQKKTAEHFLLGIPFEEFSIKDAIAIARLQAWQLGADLWSELYRLRIARSDAPSAIKAELIGAIDDHDSAIQRGNYSPHEPTTMLMPAYLSRAEKAGESFPQDETSGASNAWVVSSSLMEDNQAVLMNDPHLLHSWPSNFYAASIEIPNMKASGATFVGLPAILIGSSPHVSWGVTASYANTQDSVKLNRDKNDPQAYFVDDKKYSLDPCLQRFCFDKKGNCIEEKHYTSIFGPVIDFRYDPSISKSDLLAVMWTGFLVDEHKDITESFARLGEVKDVAQAVEAVSKISLPGVNMVLADTKGNVAYAYAGLIPKRDSTQNPYLPLDGAKLSSLWSGVLEREKKPKIINPKEGFIVTANQNIVSRGSAKEYDYGKLGYAPYRAIRIRELIEQQKKSSERLSFLDLAAIQLDSTSVEARELAPTLGRMCEEQFVKANKSRRAFANEIARFDGNFSTDSRAALPFETLLNHITKMKLAKIAGSEAATLTWVSPLNYSVANALYYEIHGKKTSIFAHDGKSFEEQIKEACEPAYQEVVAKAGSAPFKWRWGRHHYLWRQSPLAQAPLVGGFFRDQKREVAGTSASPLAEAGTPVRTGANLRLRVKMASPPEIHMILDSGNSGLPGHKNAFDQAELWHQGRTTPMVTDWQEAKRKAKNYFVLEEK
ncbi:MAG TPA: penicillin acylase family protein, partial [Myxococcota bacterium]|nr:penicillin acylase family protein [Myxococcota bacterium]